MPNTLSVDRFTTITVTGDTPTPMPRKQQQQQALFIQNLSDRTTSESESRSKPLVPPKPKVTPATTRTARPLTRPLPWLHQPQPKPQPAQVASNPSAATPRACPERNSEAPDGTTTAQTPLLKPKTRRAPEPTRAMRFKRRCTTLVPTPLKRAWAAAGDAFEGLRGGMSRLLQRLRPRQA